MNSKTILIIDDDEKLNNLLSEYLKKFNFNVLTSYSADDGIKKLKAEQPDLLILDIMLPGKDGFEACKEIRKESSIPIIMLTARGEVTDRIVGLELGADDYLPKPFEPRELVARIQSLFRRIESKDLPEVMKIGNFLVDFNKQFVLVNNSALNLTTAEFTILSILIKNSGRVLTRNKIMDALKGMDWDAYDRSIDVLISRLRQKLNDDPKKPKYIKTIWGSGYKFIGEDIEQKP
jgi:two-component system phosphate regulon response regulator OmpR